MKNKIVYVIGIVIGVVLIGLGTYDISKVISDDYVGTTGFISYKENKPVIKYTINDKEYIVKAKGFILLPKSGTQISIKYYKNNHDKYVVNEGSTILPNIFIGFIILVISSLFMLNRGVELKHEKTIKLIIIVGCIVFAVYEDIVLFNNVNLMQLVVFNLILITLISYLINSIRVTKNV